MEDLVESILDYVRADYTDYAIIGCGKKYAYGAFEVLKNTILSETLPLKDLMRKALITASKFSLACDDNIEFFEE